MAGLIFEQAPKTNQKYSYFIFKFKISYIDEYPNDKTVSLMSLILLVDKKTKNQGQNHMAYMEEEGRISYRFCLSTTSGRSQIRALDSCAPKQIQLYIKLGPSIIHVYVQVAWCWSWNMFHTSKLLLLGVSCYGGGHWRLEHNFMLQKHTPGGLVS